MISCEQNDKTKNLPSQNKTKLNSVQENTPVKNRKEMI